MTVAVHPTVTAALEVSRAQFLSDILHTSIEGGIDYWALYRNAGLHGDNLMSIQLRPDEPSFNRFDPRDDWQEINIEKVADAITKICTGTVRISKDRQDTISTALLANDAGMIDADLADCIVQVAAFGEIVFG